MRRTEQVAFDHPLWIVYSSGTTGVPKAIVHGHGGVLLEMLKATGLHADLGPEDRFHWYSSTGWIMWNFQVGALLVGSTICIYDGNPGWPDFGALWRFAAEERLTYFGAGAAFYANCIKAGVEPGRLGDLSALRSLGSTGSPLAPESYRWIYESVKRDLWLTSISGGTDVAGAFLTGLPTLPVYEGEMQCRALGARIESWDESGHARMDEVGELVCTAPMPSMPLFFWNDPGNVRLHDSYFDMFPGIWRHGDWIRLVPRPQAVGAVIYGRSDATINRHGIRMGTAELYRAVEALPEVLDSLVVDLEYLGRESYMPLFVVLRPGVALDDALRARLKSEIRRALSARHVPDEIFAIAEVPRTLSGKKLELPVKKLLLGQPVQKVVNADSMANPASLAWFVAFARERAARPASA
jgi:acetoacetyl-CoA synthetase